MLKLDVCYNLGMKPHTKETLGALSDYAGRQRGDKLLERYECNGLPVEYTVAHIPEEHRPFPYAVAASVPPGIEEYSIVVFDDVPEELRGLWAWHELHDFRVLGHQAENRCPESERVLVESLKDVDLMSRYIPVRLDFYRGLADFIGRDLAEKGEASVYDSKDLQGCYDSIKYLNEMAIFKLDSDHKTGKSS